MLDDPNKPDTLEATARDYLGQPSPIAFKNQPALPSGGGSIGVGAGPATSTAGEGVGSVKRSADFAKLVDSLGLRDDPSTQGGAGGDGVTGEGAIGDPGAAGITGFDSTTAGIGMNLASLALGAPGLVGLAGGLLGTPGLATGVPGVGNALSLTSLANSIAGPNSNLTLNAAQGPMAVSPTYSGFLDALTNAITGKPNFTVMNARGELSAAPPSATPGFTEGGPHPAFGFQGFNSPYGMTPADYSGPKTNIAIPEGPPGSGQGPAGPAGNGVVGDTGVTSGQTGEPGGPPGQTGVSGGDGGGGGGKVICTAMNAAYGFGAFRNAVWLAYAKEHLTPEHERGYHRLALPMIRYAYHGRSWPRRAMRACMEHVVRHRSVDLWLTMRGRRRDPLGRVYRAALEPLCRVLGA